MVRSTRFVRVGPMQDTTILAVVVDAIRADEAILDVWSIRLGTDR